MAKVTGTYCELETGIGYLADATTLDTSNATAAVAEADDIITQRFFAYDRTDWTLTEPGEVSRAAYKYAAGEYLDRVYSFGNPIGDGEQLSARLKREALAAIDRINGDGGPLLSDGTRQQPVTTTNTDGISALTNDRFIDWLNG